jgi:hypothetical protein
MMEMHDKFMFIASKYEGFNEGAYLSDSGASVH